MLVIAMIAAFAIIVAIIYSYHIGYVSGLKTMSEDIDKILADFMKDKEGQ